MHRKRFSSRMGRVVTIGGDITEVTIQFIDASTHELVATTTAAGGWLKTEPDKIRKAILKSLKNLFER